MSRRRVLAIFRKDMREFRRNKLIIYTMALSPIGFLVAPLIFLFAVPASDASTLYQYPVLLFTLAMAALVPVTVGAYSITGEREQGTLEPVRAGRPSERDRRCCSTAQRPLGESSGMSPRNCRR